MPTQPGFSQTHPADSLLDDVLLDIFNLLIPSPCHLFACTLVSRHWHSLVTPLLWQHPRFKHWDRTEQEPIFAKYGCWVRDLALLHDFCDDLDVNLVANTCPEVRELDFSGTMVTGEGVKMICEAPGIAERLEGLFLNSMQNGLSGECLEDVARLRNLRRLSIAEMSDLEDDEIIRVVETCRLLEAVDFGDTEIGDETLKAMSECLARTLQTANLNFCKNITDTGVRTLVERCERLERLGLNGCQLTDEILSTVGEVVGDRLRSISIARCGTMTSNGFATLFRKCTNLELVDAELSNVGPPALEELGTHIRAIRYLGLLECHQINDSAILQLMTGRGVEQLQHLDISLCMSISDLAFGTEGTWRCLALQYLNISGLEIGDSALRALSHLTLLISLDVVACHFSSTAMMSFFANKPLLLRVNLSCVEDVDDILFEWIVDSCERLRWCNVVDTFVTKECIKKKLKKRDKLIVEHELVPESVHCGM